jgi:DNA-directed RNA polymerase specialized sigma24 family protein
MERTALLMAAQGVSGIEIADYLGRSPAATRTMMCRARLRLRAELTQALAIESTPPPRVPASAAIAGGRLA